MAKLFQDLWLKRARRSEIDVTLGYFLALRRCLSAAEQWCRQRLDQRGAGQSPSYDLSEYSQTAADYETLGHGYWRKWSKVGLLPD